MRSVRSRLKGGSDEPEAVRKWWNEISQSEAPTTNATGVCSAAATSRRERCGKTLRKDSVNGQQSISPEPVDAVDERDPSLVSLCPSTCIEHSVTHAMNSHIKQTGSSKAIERVISECTEIIPRSIRQAIMQRVI